MTKSNLQLLGCNTNLAMSFPENKPQKQTYWFYKWPLWLRILLLITLPGIFIPVAVWPKIKIPNWVKGVLLIPWSFIVLIAYIIMLAIIVSPFSSTSTKGPIFSVSGISEGEIKKDDKVSFKIKTYPLTVDEVTINGESATKKGWDSEYSLDKTFPEGDNSVKIVAKKDGKITEKEFNFKVDLDERKAVEEAKKQEEKNKDIVDQNKSKSTTSQQNTAPTSNVTVGQKNALAKAKSYLNYSAFSYEGLIAQLEYEQFSNADAVYGADNCGADWNEQAAKKAKSYMEYSSFSRGSLINQLKFEKFTQSQAEYGASTVGL